jgi:hypothetical protein
VAPEPEERDEGPCWVAFASCGHMVFAAADEPQFAAGNAKEVARMIRDGLRVEKMATSDVRAAAWCPRDCERRKSRRPSKQRDLFEVAVKVEA